MCIQRTAALLSSGGRSLVLRFRGRLDSSAVTKLSGKLLATGLDGAELVLKAGCGAGSIELSHQAVVLGAEDNTSSVHGGDHTGDFVEREGLSLGLLLRRHVDWRLFRTFE